MNFTDLINNNKRPYKVMVMGYQTCIDQMEISDSMNPRLLNFVSTISPIYLYIEVFP
jgi:hypothetical protein